MSVRLKVRAPAPVDDFVFGVSLFNADGVCCYGTNTYLEEMDPRAARPATPRWSFAIDSLDLVEGTYKLDVAVHKRDGYPVRLPPAALHVPGQVAGARRRHLSARATIGRFSRRGSLQAGEVHGGIAQRRRVAAAQQRLAALRAAGKTWSSPTACSICCIPGTFAIFRRARGLGDALIVGVNSDRSVRAIKGPGARSRRRTSGPRSSPRSRAWMPWWCSTRTRRTTIISGAPAGRAGQGRRLGRDAIVGRDIVEARGGRVVRMPVEAGLLDRPRIVEKITEAG